MTAEPAAAYGDIHRLRRNIGSNYLTVIAQAAFLVLATPYVIDALGAEIFGGWAVILAVVGYLRLLDLGLGPATARFVAVASSPAELSSTVSTALASLAGAAVLGLLAAALAIAAVPGLLPGIEGLRTALALAAISTALQIPLGVFSHLLFGLERIYERNLTYLARVLASAAALVIAVEAGGGLVAFVGAMAAAELAVMLAQAVWCLARLDQLEVRPRHVTSAMLRVMVPFGASMFAIGVATQIAVYSSGLVVAGALGAVAVATYTVAVRAVDGASLLLAQFSDVFLPVFARLGRDSEQDRSTTLVRLGTRLGLVLGYPLIALLIGLGEPLIEVWVGDGFEDSWGPLALLAASLIFAVPLRFGLLWAIGTGRQGRIAVVALCDSLANIAAAISLVGVYGLEGVALAALGALWISNGLIMPRMIFPAAGVRMWSGYYRPTLLALGAMAPFVLVMRFVLTPWLDHAAPTLLATIAWLILGTALLAALLTEKEERKQLRAMIRR
jgi:O-antigen/teichoic acid export membrane protein